MATTITPTPHSPYKDRICTICKLAFPVMMRVGLKYYCVEHYDQAGHGEVPE